MFALDMFQVFLHPRFLYPSVTLLIGTFTYAFWKWLVQRNQILNLGGYAPGMKTYIPFGFGWMADQILDTIYYQNLRTWQKRMNEISPTCHTIETRFPGPLGLRVIFTDDTENIKAILATHFDDYGKGEMVHKNWEPLLGNSIFMTDGELWHASRQLVRPQFAKSRVSDLKIFETNVQVLINSIVKNGVGKEIDIYEVLHHYTLDVATDFLLGRSANNMMGENMEFSEAFSEAQRQCLWFARLGPAGVFFSRDSYNANLKIINDFIEPFIDEALSFTPEELETRSKHESNFLHHLASFSRDRKLLRDQIIGVLLGGRDTISSALSWLFYELGRHPEVVIKLRKEIIETIGLDNEPTYTELKNMKYLQYCINETLRLYPPVAINYRFSLNNTSLPNGGTSKDGRVGVLKGTLILYSTMAQQRNKAIYPPDEDISVFNPDWWYNWQPKPWEYTPFSGGPRICVGQQFALAEMGYTVSRLLQRFECVEGFMDYERLDRTGGNMKIEVVLEVLEGVRVGFR